MRIPKAVKNTLIVFIVMIVLFGVVGVAYVYISGKNPYQPPKAEKTPAPAEAQPFPKPKKPSPNAKEGVAVESLISPVSRGSNTAITIKTNATSTCTIKVEYNGTASHDSGLKAKPTDDYGTVTWTWTVDKTAPIGTWPVTVTCVYNGRSGVVIGNLEVTK
jgi:hypothetical protein